MRTRSPSALVCPQKHARTERTQPGWLPDREEPASSPARPPGSPAREAGRGSPAVAGACLRAAIRPTLAPKRLFRAHSERRPNREEQIYSNLRSHALDLAHLPAFRFAHNHSVRRRLLRQNPLPPLRSPISYLAAQLTSSNGLWRPRFACSRFAPRLLTQSGLICRLPLLLLPRHQLTPGGSSRLPLESSDKCCLLATRSFVRSSLVNFANWNETKSELGSAEGSCSRSANSY